MSVLLDYSLRIICINSYVLLHKEEQNGILFLDLKLNDESHSSNCIILFNLLIRFRLSSTVQVFKDDPLNQKIIRLLNRILLGSLKDTAVVWAAFLLLQAEASP